VLILGLFRNLALSLQYESLEGNMEEDGTIIQMVLLLGSYRTQVGKPSKGARCNVLAYPLVLYYVRGGAAYDRSKRLWKEKVQKRGKRKGKKN